MRPPRLLIVDDDELFRGVALRNLQRAGFECLAAASGAEALSCVALRSPDLLLLDVRMEGLNGFDVYRSLRADPHTAQLPVVFLSGARDAELIESAGLMVKASFVVKPVDFLRLARHLRQLHAGRALKPADPDMIVREPLRIDLKRRRVLVKGRPIRLGRTRFDLLCALARSKDAVPAAILRALVWGSKNVVFNILAMTIVRLRADLKRACGREMILTTLDGYKLL